MQKYKKFIKPTIYSVLFIYFIIIGYRSARPRYKPENFTDIFNDFSWLVDWPKWLDFPLMQPLNAGFDWLIVNYGLFFETINNFLLGLYTSMKRFFSGPALATSYCNSYFYYLFCKWKKNKHYCHGGLLYFFFLDF